MKIQKNHQIAIFAFIILSLIFSTFLVYKKFKNDSLATVQTKNSNTTKNDGETASKEKILSTYNQIKPTSTEGAETPLSEAKTQALSQIKRLEESSFYAPDSPYEAYVKHFASASNGNFESQYIIYKIFKDCRLFQKNYFQTSINMPQKNSDKNSYFNEYTKLHYKHCATLANDPNLNREIYDKLKKSLSSAGHPVFLIKELSTKRYKHATFTNSEINEHKNILVNSIKIDPQKSYAYISSYFEKSLPNSKIEKEAWSYIECKNRTNSRPCKKESVRKKLMQKGFYANDVDQIFRSADEYTQLINENKWDELFTHF